MGERLIYSSVGTFVYNTEVFPTILPKINAVVDRIRVEVVEGLWLLAGTISSSMISC
jgi:hypothetical protein